MRKLIFLMSIILTCSLYLDNSRGYAEELAKDQHKLTTFHNERGDISIRYPEGWFIREYRYNNPYSVFLSREKVEKPTVLFKVGISIWKFYHQSWYLGLDSDDIDKSLNLLLDNYNKDVTYPNKKIEKKKTTVIDKGRALREEVSFDTPAGYRDKMIVLYAMKDDIVVQLLYEAPETEFEQYRHAFEESIKTAKIFSSDDMLSDNLLLDREIDQLILNVEDLSKDVAQVLSVYEKAISMNPDYAKTRFLRGSFLIRNVGAFPVKDQEAVLKEAEEESNLAIELYNKHPQDYEEGERKQNIAQCHFNKGLILVYEAKTAEANGLLDIYEAKLKETIEEFKNAIEFDPEYPIAYFNLGLSYKSLGKFEEAIPYIQKTIDLMPDWANWAEAYFELGRLYYLLKQYDEAIVFTEKGLAINPNASIYNVLANIYDEDKSDYDKAIECCQKAIAIDKNNIEAYMNLGYIYGARKGDYDKAIEHYQKVIGINPNYAKAYRSLAAAYWHKKDKSSLSEQIRKLRDLNRNDLADEFQELLDKLE